MVAEDKRDKSKNLRKEVGRGKNNEGMGSTCAGIACYPPMRVKDGDGGGDSTSGGVEGSG